MTEIKMSLKKLVLTACLVSFSILPSNVVLAQESTAINTQSHTLKGQVIDQEKKAPIAGVKVKVNTTNGSVETLTDDQGNYSIAVSDTSGTITISGDNLVEKTIDFS